MTDVVVTGATGFVGHHVMEGLHGRAARVRAVVRETSDTRHLRSLGVEICTASLSDPAALRATLEGATTVIHLAALTHARTEAELQRVNGQGTAALVDAAVASRHDGAAVRFVYLSSLAAVGPSLDGAPVTPSTEPRPLTAYGRSKLAGEAPVKAARSRGIEDVILRAPAVYGPGDRELLRFFRLARIGVMPIPGGSGRRLQMVHVEDLARAIADAAAAPSLTGLFHIADPQAYDMAELYRLVGAAVGRSPKLLRVPGAAIELAAAVSELSAKAVNRSTMFSREKVRELLAPGWLCETAGAKEAFGFAAGIPLAQGLRDTAEWYRFHGWL
ncbi:MAG TPA: NAD-dependent epimerase/dehydratase family protein [Longimicrobiales bacterium]